jgi:hypothetical protein
VSARWRRAPPLALAALALLGAAPARADDAPTYRGDYGSAFMAGRTAAGKEVSVMVGFHTDFPYHDPSSHFDQLAVQVGGSEPTLVTGRPKLPGFTTELGEKTVRFSYTSHALAFDLVFASVRHTTRFEGDPAQLGDFFLQFGIPSDQSPGFVYTPYELTGLLSGTLAVDGRAIKLGSLHGQAEAGHIDIPTDRRFQAGYEYLAAPTPGAGHHARPFTYVDFNSYALHSGDEGVLDSYYRQTASDEFTMEGGALAGGNPHGVPTAYDNTGRLPHGATKLDQWAVDVGPGIIYRKLLRLRDRSGRGVLAFSETIKEDAGGGPDATPPVIVSAKATPATICAKRTARCRGTDTTISFVLSEDTLVSIHAEGSDATVLFDARAGPGAIHFSARGLAPGRRTLVLRATDQAGNRSRPVALRLTVRRR